MGGEVSTLEQAPALVEGAGDGEQQLQSAPDYESMSKEDLRKVVDAELNASAPGEKPQATEDGQQQTQQDAPKEPTIADLLKRLDGFENNTKRELGSFRSLASLKDQLPALIQQQLRAMQAAQTQQQLSPEDQQAQQNAKQQEAYLRQMIQGVLGDVAKPQMELLNQLQEERSDSKYMSDVFGMVEGKIPDAKNIWQDIWKENAEKIEAGDQSAIAWHERALKEPSLIAYEMLTRHSAKVQSKGQEFQAQRSQASSQAAQAVKQGGLKVSTKKALSDMSQDELDALSTDELKRRTQEEGHFAG